MASGHLLVKYLFKIVLHLYAIYFLYNPHLYTSGSRLHLNVSVTGLSFLYVLPMLGVFRSCHIWIFTIYLLARFLVFIGQLFMRTEVG